MNKKKIGKKIGGKVSNKPYIMEIKKIKNNESLINSNEILQFNKEFSPVSGSEFNYDPDKWNKNYKMLII